MVVEGKAKGTSVLWKANVPLVFSLKVRKDCLEWQYAFLKYMGSTKLKDDIENEFGCECHRWNTTVGVDYGMRRDDIRDFSVDYWFRLEPLSSLCDIVQVVRSKYSVKRFCKASVSPYRSFYQNRFYRN